MHQSQIDEDVISKELKLDLSNAVSVYVKNIGASECKFGLQTILANKEYSMDLNNTMLLEKTTMKVSFKGGAGSLFYRIIRFSKQNCNIKNKN